MKRLVLFLIVAVLSVSLTGCGLIVPKVQYNVEVQYTDTFPMNEFTQSIPELPSEKVEYTVDDSEHGNFTVAVSGVTTQSYSSFLDSLLDSDFQIVASSEEDTSSTILLEKDNVNVSAAFSDDTLVVRISLLDK